MTLRARSDAPPQPTDQERTVSSTSPPEDLAYVAERMRACPVSRNLTEARKKNRAARRLSGPVFTPQSTFLAVDGVVVRSTRTMPTHFSTATTDPTTIREAARLLLVYASLSSAARQRLLKERLIARAADLRAESGERRVPASLA
jgi:hypothetical protein